MCILHVFTFTILLTTSLAQDQYPDGNFIFPKNGNEKDWNSFLRVQEGTQMTITWNTTYKRSNLFYSNFGNDGQSQPLASMFFSFSVDVVNDLRAHEIAFPMKVSIS